MTAPATARGWLCCQLGAREHYAVPRGLNRVGRLRGLVADAWVHPGSLAGLLPGEAGRRIRERYHPELAAVPVTASTFSLLGHELIWRGRGVAGWDLAIDRNEWFQRRAAAAIDKAADAADVVFAHSYAALEIFRRAKARGCVTVLGQIDPGPEHFAIARRLAAQHREFGDVPAEPPPAYFDDWREECSLADHIVVNSEWSRQAVERAGVPPGKLSVVPLPYEAESRRTVTREYPERFSSTRPLRVLFVGTASVTKGIPELLEAMRLVRDLPIQLELVGGSAMLVSDETRRQRALRWTGPVLRSTVMERYRACDLLVFPSHSDGFGMAQVEARAWGLPIVASRQCGAVVADRETGWLLPEVTGPAIARVLREAVSAPGLLRQYASTIQSGPAFTVDHFGTAMAAIA